MTLMATAKKETCSRKSSQDTFTKLDNRKKRSSRLSSRPPGKKTKGEMDKSDVAKELRENIPCIRTNFNVLSKVGEGTFSKVYIAQLKSYPDEVVAIKYIVPTSSPTKVKNELACLQKLGGKRNVISVKTTLRNNDHIAFILPYFKHDKFQTFFKVLNANEIRDYMKNLFIALEHVHQYNIIHRDVKPSNFLHSRETKRYSLVDFGLAMQVPGTTGFLSDDKGGGNSVAKTRSSSREAPSSQDCVAAESTTARRSTSRGSKCPTRSKRQRSEPHLKSDILCKIGHHSGHPSTSVCSFCCSRPGQVAPRAGTSGFRAPEVLMKHPNQTTAVDIWSAGIILLSFLSGRYPFFKAKDDLSSLAQIVSVFGTEEVAAVGSLMGKNLTCSHHVTPIELKTLCEGLRQRACKYHQISRHKRKYCSIDGKSKRAKIEHFSEIVDDDANSTKGYCNATCSSTIDGALKCSEVATQTTNARVSVHSPSKRQGLRSSDKIEELTMAIDNRSSHLKSSGTMDVDSTRPEFRNKSVRASNNIMAADCYCIPDSAYDLLSKCLTLDSSQRITASDALNHQFLTS